MAKTLTITLGKGNDFVVMDTKQNVVLNADNFKQAYWYCMGWTDSEGKTLDAIGITDEAVTYAARVGSNIQLLHNLAESK